jgi:hypothetical protein
MTANAEKPYGRTGPQRREPKTRSLYVWLIVLVAVIGTIVAGTWAYLATRPCVPPGGEVPVGARVCPGPPLPSPTTLIANGTIFTIGAGQSDYFQFQLSAATFAVLTGSFTATHGAAVYVMTPGDFANFSSLGAAKYQCSPTEYCFGTGQVSAGSVNISVLPVFQSDQGGRMVVDPWFLIMQNSNTSAATNVTWVASLVATYVDVYASFTTTVAGAPRSLSRNVG